MPQWDSEMEEGVETDGDEPNISKSALHSSRCIPKWLKEAQRELYLALNNNMRHIDTFWRQDLFALLIKRLLS